MADATFTIYSMLLRDRLNWVDWMRHYNHSVTITSQSYNAEWLIHQCVSLY